MSTVTIYERLGYVIPTDRNLEAEKNMEILLEASRRLTREKYEAECEKYGIAPVADAELGSYSDRFFSLNFGAHGFDRFAGEDFFLDQLSCVLRQQRWFELKDEPAYKAAQTPARKPSQPPQASPRFGGNGTRYDEECPRCGVVSVLDNYTDLCERCFAASPYPVLSYRDGIDEEAG